ncbi:MAG TPA: acyl carrier protein [Caulobacteraceae bacterium]|jgi:acyl carrier protein
MTHGLEANPLARVRAIVAEVLGIPVQETTDDLAMYGHPRWDSVAQIDIILQLEDEFGLTVDDAMAPRFTTVALMAEQIGAAA